VSYADKRRSLATCKWPDCDETGTSLALGFGGKPEWFCLHHHLAIKEKKR
jgi:hypothetical protein